MVGRKTSPRCANCRQRKVKCDLARPSCSQCVKSKWPCPGYDTHSRFYAYTLDAGKPKATSHDCGSSTSSTATTPAGQALVSSRRARSVSVFPLSSADVLRNQFIFKIAFQGVAARLVVIPDQHVLKHIPIRIGTSKALDDAVNCICSDNGVGERKLADMPFTQCVPSSSLLYSKALMSLQRALSEEGERISAESMAAATLLQMHEHSMAPSCRGWIAHARGVIRMLELRGPSQIDSDLDAAILHAQSGNIFIDAIQNRTVCFLTNPRWRALLRGGSPFDDAKQDAAHNSMMAVGFSLPGIISLFEDFNSGIRDAKQLVVELNRVCEPLMEWEKLYPVQYSGIQQPDGLVGENVRMSHASRISFNVAYMLICYIAVQLKVPTQGLNTKTINFEQPLKLLHAVNAIQRLDKFSTSARAELRALETVDDHAASGTAWFMKTLLARVLSASKKTPELLYLQEIMENLSNDMAAAVAKYPDRHADPQTSLDSADMTGGAFKRLEVH